jgi:hypothetical protein
LQGGRQERGVREDKVIPSRGLVEDENLGLAQQGTRKADELPLPSAEVGAALGHGRVGSATLPLHEVLAAAPAIERRQKELADGRFRAALAAWRQGRAAEAKAKAEAKAEADAAAELHAAEHGEATPTNEAPQTSPTQPVETETTPLEEPKAEDTIEEETAVAHTVDDVVVSSDHDDEIIAEGEYEGSEPSLSLEAGEDGFVKLRLLEDTEISNIRIPANTNIETTLEHAEELVGNDSARPLRPNEEFEPKE